MCELLALSANTPTDLCFSFLGLTRRGGATGDHSDGWGLASFEPDGGGVRIFREDAPAAFSPVAARVAELPLRAHCSIAHIRKATQGTVALANCHPFHRRWRGQTWVCAHNGHLEGPIPTAPGFEPQGDTDSEAAFCWLLGEIERHNLDPQDDDALFACLAHGARQLARRGTFNVLIANGQWLFAFATTRLHHLTRRAPFRAATLTDADLSVDFARLTGPDDVVTILCTEPLTRDECWQPMQPGEAVLLRRGELVARQLGTLPSPALAER